MKTPKASCVILIATVCGIMLGSSAHAQTEPDEEESFGNVVIRSSIDRPGEINKHRMQMHVERVYQFTVEPKNKTSAATIRIMNDKGAILEQSSGQGKTAVGFSPTADGIYHVAIAGAAGRPIGLYSLTVEMRVGFTSKVFNGQLTQNDPFDKVRRQCRFKAHVLRLRVGQTYVIDMEARWDTYLRIEDSGGRNLMMDDDGGNGLNSRITFRPKQTDNYRIIATSFSSNGIGPYKLTVRRLGTGRAILAIKGSLANTDGKDRVIRGSYFKSYAVNLKAGQVYTIDLTSAQLDPYLRLEYNGRVLFSDNNSGGGRDSRITYRPTQTGIYQIFATTAVNNQTGNFALTVREN